MLISGQLYNRKSQLQSIDVQKNRVMQLRAGTLNLQGFGNFVLERSTLKVFVFI